MNSNAQQIATLHRAAQAAMRAGHLQTVHQHCLAILALDQHFADAWFLCGIIAAHNGQLEKALEIFRRAVQLAPRNTEYLTELGKQLIAVREPQKALLTAREAIALKPQGLPTLNTLGTVFSHCGEHEDALACFEQAVAGLHSKDIGNVGLSPQWRAELFFNTAASRQFAGRFDAAEEAYEQAIALQPALYKAHSALSMLRRQSADNNHLQRLNALRSRVSTAADQLHLGHALAKEYEDLEQYPDALGSWRWAKQAQSSRVKYNAASDAELMAAISRIFSAAQLRTAASGCVSEEPIFIVGMPRTGTTLVERILAGHSQVTDAGELQNFPLQVKRMTATPSVDMVDIATFEHSVALDMTALGSNYIDSTRPRTGMRPRFIDKLPLNFMYVGLIKLALPGAKIICLRRDPMDTCLSNYRQLFATHFRYYHYNYDLLDCGRYYLEFDRLMRHWQSALPDGLFEVHYENLVENPEREARRLMAYCALPWEEECLSFNRHSGSVATASAVQVRQSIYTSSINRWQRYGDAMQPLHKLLQAAGTYG